MIRPLISLLFISLVMSAYAHAQIVIDSASISQSYFNQVHSKTSSAYTISSVDLGTSDDSFQEWDFSAVVVSESDTSQYQFYSAEQHSSLPAEFLASDYFREMRSGSSDNPDIQRIFIDVAESGVYNTGLEIEYRSDDLDTALYSVPDKPQLVFPLPLTLNTKRNQTSKTALFTDTGIDSLLSTVSISADAFGIAIFPDEKSRSVIRMINLITEERISYNRDGSTDVETISVKEVMFLAEDGSSLQFTVDSLWNSGPATPVHILADFTGEVTLVSNESPQELITTPKTISLMGNFPNPFNPATTIRFSLQEASPVTLEVFSLHGRQVYRETGMVYPSGEHTIRVESRNWPSGIYWYRISNQIESVTGKMTLIK